eukprot:1131726-Pyramimonas_sp.AAC.1
MSSWVRAGARVAVQWRAGESLQIRYVLTDCDGAEYEDICGEPPPALAAAEGRLKYCLAPDGDVYPHALKCPPLHSLTAFDETGQELV